MREKFCKILGYILSGIFIAAGLAGFVYGGSLTAHKQYAKGTVIIVLGLLVIIVAIFETDEPGVLLTHVIASIIYSILSILFLFGGLILGFVGFINIDSSKQSVILGIIEMIGGVFLIIISRIMTKK